MADFVERSCNISSKDMNLTRRCEGAWPLVLETGKKIRSTKTPTKSKLLGGQYIVWFQEVDNLSVYYALHDFGQDTQ